MNDSDIQKIIDLAKTFPEIKLLYFFGSRATGNSGPMSDYDFGIYLDDCEKNVFLQVELQAKLSLILVTDDVDVVVLNTVQNPLLAFNIIFTGKLLYEVEPYKIMIEPKIMNKYFDFKMEIDHNYLTKANQ